MLPLLSKTNARNARSSKIVVSGSQQKFLAFYYKNLTQQKDPNFGIALELFSGARLLAFNFSEIYLNNQLSDDGNSSYQNHLAGKNEPPHDDRRFFNPLSLKLST